MQAETADRPRKIAPGGDAVQGIEPTRSARSTYKAILKSSALIGGSSALSIGVGIFRTKALAVLLGPSGFGMLSLYTSILDLAVSIAGMGLGGSGVRQIAEANSSGDKLRLSRTATALRRTAVLIGLVGALVLFGLSAQVSRLTFGSEQHAGAVSFLAVALFLRVVSDCQVAVIQGTRQIAELAQLGVVGSLLAAVVSVLLVSLYGQAGIAPALVGGAATTLLAAWWYSRKVRVEPVRMSPAEVAQEATALLKLGFAFMSSGLMMLGASYLVRMIVFHEEGLDAAGLYQAAWSLGGMYVGVILQAMGADFYPRLVGVVKQHDECNRVVNEQALVSLLLAGPGVIATLTLAPLVIELFYSSKFLAAVDLLQWMCLGVALRVITWPMGFIIVAKNKQRVFIAAEIAWAVVNVGLTWLCVRKFGMVGAGIAFFASYVFHGMMIYPIVRRMTGFRWSPETVTALGIFLCSISIVFGGFLALPPTAATACGLIVATISAVYSVRRLMHAVSPERMPRPLRRLVDRLRTITR